MNRGIKMTSIKIEIKTFVESMEETIEAVKRLEKGEKVRLNKLVFNDIETFRKILTKERMRILSYIKYKKPNSIYELAKGLDRDWRLVSNDVSLLNSLGLVKLEKKKEQREAIKPTVNFSRMDIRIAI